MENFGILSLLPPILAIVMAFITKNTLISLFSGVFVGALMLSNWNPVLALINLFSDTIFPVIGDEWNQTIILAVFFIGAFALMIEKGGGAGEFANVLTKKIKTRRKGNILTWVGGLAVFFCDATNAVLVGPIFRPITDHLKISREKLAYNIDSTSATVPALLPFTAWGAYIIGILANEFEKINYSGNPLTLFVQGSVYQYYTIGAILAVLIFAVTGLDFGPMKKAEDRAYYEGKLISDTAEPLKPVSVVEIPEHATPTIWNMVLPLILLVVILLSMFLWTGGFPNIGILEAMGNADAMLSLVVAFFIAGIVAMILTIRSKVFTFKESWSVYLEGFEQMAEANFVLILAWSIGSITSDVGTADFVVGIAHNVLTPTTMLLAIFIAASVTGFTTGSSWGTFAIFLPISIPLAVAINAPMGAAIGAVISGGIFGDHCSPISDTTILSSMGASADHLDHVKTQMPYALLIAFASGIGYLIAGKTSGPLLGLVSTIAIIFIAIVVLNKIDKIREEKKEVIVE